MRDLIFFVVFAGSWILAPVALFVLIRRREYRRALGFGTFMVAVPLFVNWAFSQQDAHFRKWLGYPAGLLLVFWLFSAFWLFDAAWGSAHARHTATPRGPWLTRRRRIAAAVTVTGLALWFFGFSQTPENELLEFAILIGSSGAVLLGAVNFAVE